MNIIQDIAYLVSSCLFVIGIKMQNKVKTARSGNLLSAFGMFLAIVVTLLYPGVVNYVWMGIMALIGSVIGWWWAEVVQMTAMPQMVAIFNGFGGLASALVSASEYIRTSGSVTDMFSFVSALLGTFVGAITFAGSYIAYAKLEGFIKQRPIVYPFQKTTNFLIFVLCIGLGADLVAHPAHYFSYWALMAASLALGALLVFPIGGADMPVVISLLNSYSGIAGAITGFILMNKVLIVSGALVGASGIILCEVMCRAMNRSLVNVIFGSFGQLDESKPGGGSEYTNVKSCSAEEAAMVLDGAQSVIIVPGYGLAAARAQHAVKELAKLLETKGATVKFAIHPVAGRMPGHMNILLAEADVPYEQLYEMDNINPEFEQTDVAIVIGANDVTNPSARNDRGSPIYGMPILDVDKAKSVIVVKRSLSPGFAGIKNPLFENNNTMMYFADGKAAIDALTKELKSL